MRTIKAIRRDNLKYLISSRYKGIANRLAVEANIYQAQLARILSDGENRRDMGDKLARTIESAAGLPTGWLDQEHASSDDITKKLKMLTVEQRTAVESIVDQLLTKQ